jgi:hypothetical protein
MPMMFFHFLKIIFDISTSKRSKKYKPHSILAKKKIQNLMKRSYKRNAKQSLNRMELRYKLFFKIFVILKYIKIIFLFLTLTYEKN